MVIDEYSISTSRILVNFAIEKKKLFVQKIFEKNYSARMREKKKIVFLAS